MIYKIVTGVLREILQDRVNDHLEAGFELQGGVSVTLDPNRGDLVYSQAMIAKDHNSAIRVI